MPKQVWKPSTLLTPTPAALVTCGTMDHPNVLTVAWTGIVCSSPAMTYVSIRPERFSHHLIEESGEFVINVTTAELVRAADFCGCRSGADTDKFAEAGLTPVPASQVAPPLIEESPVSLECKVVEIKRLGSHDFFLAEIVAVDVDDAYITADGKLNLRQCGIAFYSHGEYFGQGKKLGQMGYSVRKKRPKSPKQSSAEHSQKPAKAPGEGKNLSPSEFRNGKPVLKKREKHK